MSTPSEKIQAQKEALRVSGFKPGMKHLIGPIELQHLLSSDKQNRERGMHLATLCDMVLGEDAKDRSDEALIRGVRKLINKCQE